ncbi:MAG: DUF916 domain-containing protein [Nocardioidaceae bacterium]|nr:MAG: DUF916 domain-containing protein [Nocardioidaceae bacterium]
MCLTTRIASLTTRLIVAMTIVMGGLAAVPSLAAAADPEPTTEPTTWGIAPATKSGPDTRDRFEYIVEPGERYDDHIAIRNLGNTTLTVDLYAADATTATDGAFSVLSRDEESTGSGSWINLRRERVRVPARQTRVVAFSMRVPANAEPGDHAAGILASVTTESDSVGIERRVGTRVYARVAGNVSPGLEISRIEAGHDVGWNPLSLGGATARFSLTNTGNLRISAEVVSESAGLLGLGHTLSAPNRLPELLPGASLEITQELPGALPLGPMRLTVVGTPVESAGQASTEWPIEVTADASYWAWHPGWLTLLVLIVVAVAVTVHWIRRNRQGRDTAPGTPAARTAQVLEPRL